MGVRERAVYHGEGHRQDRLPQAEPTADSVVTAHAGAAGLVSPANPTYIGSMADTNSPSEDPLYPFRALEPGEIVSPEHEAWLKAEIEKTLDASKRGELRYTDYREVMKKFGFDAP
jgi:hypothetical protein